jgi:hypothetical protein
MNCMLAKPRLLTHYYLRAGGWRRVQYHISQQFNRAVFLVCVFRAVTCDYTSREKRDVCAQLSKSVRPLIPSGLEIWLTLPRSATDKDWFFSNDYDMWKTTALWDVTPCILVEVDRRFRGAYCLNHHSDEVMVFWIVAPEYCACTSTFRKNAASIKRVEIRRTRKVHFVVYLTTLFSNHEFTASNERTISERRIAKGCGRSGRGLI